MNGVKIGLSEPGMEGTSAAENIIRKLIDRQNHKD